MIVTDSVTILLHIVLLIMVIFKMISPIIILYITISAIICFITYFFFKLIKKLVGFFIYYKTYNYNLSLENRINNLERIVLFISSGSSIDSFISYLLFISYFF